MEKTKLNFEEKKLKKFILLIEKIRLFRNEDLKTSFLLFFHW